jgi:hypothetical protein
MFFTNSVALGIEPTQAGNHYSRWGVTTVSDFTANINIAFQTVEYLYYFLYIFPTQWLCWLYALIRCQSKHKTNFSVVLF